MNELHLTYDQSLNGFVGIVLKREYNHTLSVSMDGVNTVD